MRLTLFGRFHREAAQEFSSEERRSRQACSLGLFNLTDLATCLRAIVNLSFDPELLGILKGAEAYRYMPLRLVVSETKYSGHERLIVVR